MNPVTKITRNLPSSLHILGAGSIGQLWAISLRVSIPQYPLTLLLRETGGKTEQTYMWKPYGSQSLTNVVVPIQPTVVGQRIHPPSDGSDEQNPILETLLVTTKSYQAKDAVQTILEHSTIRPSRIILLCNGALSVREELLPLVRAKNIPLILATTTHGAYREGALEDENTSPCVVHAGVGQTFLQEEAADIIEAWNIAGLNCTTLSLSEMELFLWKKLAANAVINPLTALFGCKNGELLLEPSFFELQHELLHEISLIAQASLQERGETDESPLTSSTTTTTNEESLRQFVQKVIENTRENKSSMFQDMLLGKKTEIDHLNGYIVRKGRTFGIECPANEDIVSRILERSVGRKSRDVS